MHLILPAISLELLCNKAAADSRTAAELSAYLRKANEAGTHSQKAKKREKNVQAR